METAVSTTIKDCCRLLRIKHWVKDVFVFAPLVFSLNFYKMNYLWKALAMFVAFSLASSVVYVINDIVDRDRDRHHPSKRFRPIASGRVSPATASILASILFLLMLSITPILNLASVAMLLAYIGLNIFYSLFLKKQVCIDVMIIATGFLLRIIAGGVSIQVELSRWMLLATFFLAMFLGFSKRRCEMIVTSGSKQHRSVFRHYSLELLNSLIVISATLTIITYSLYVLTSNNLDRIGSNWFIITIPFVVFGVFRYLYLIYHQSKGGDPTEILLKDRVMLGDILLWGATVFVLLLHSVYCGGQS